MPVKKSIILVKDTIEGLQINKEYETVKPIVIEKIDWNKVTRPNVGIKIFLKN